MNKKLFISIFILTVAVLALVITDVVLAAKPCFNCMPNDKETLRLKNRTAGDSEWQDPISANPGNVIGFDIYYHNSGLDSTARNTRTRITFPTDLRT